VLAIIADAIELAGLQVCASLVNLWEGGFAEDLGSNVSDRTIGDLMDEADIAVLTRRYSGNHFAPGDFGIDDGLATTAAIVDHHDEILHAGDVPHWKRQVSISENRNKVKKNSEKQNSLRAEARRRNRSSGYRYRPADLAALRVRAAALLRNRSIWPLGRVTQISPIHSSLTPVIGLALKLVRLTEVGDFPRSIVFR
jgi:hypothetical protein